MPQSEIDKRLATKPFSPHVALMNREALLKNIPPLIGLVIMIGAGILLRRFFLLAIPIGLVAWWGSHKILSRYWGDGAQIQRRNRVKAIPDARHRQDMSQALARIETLKSLNTQIPDERITAALDKLADRAAFLVDEALRRPARAGVAHRPLMLYLEDAVEVSQGFADLQRFESLSEEEIAKTATSLEHLIQLFQTYAARMKHQESEDLDVKITVLEDRLRGEGIFDR